MQDQSIVWFSILVVLLTVGICAVNLTLAYWARKNFRVAGHRRWLAATGVFFFTLYLWGLVAVEYSRGLYELSQVSSIGEWTLTSPFVIPVLLVLDLLIFRVVPGGSTGISDDNQGKQKSLPLVSIAWLAMSCISIIYALVLLLPVYTLGIYRMTYSQIWSTGFDMSWHPYYALTSGMEGTGPVFYTGFYLGLPLFLLLIAELIVRWRKLPHRAIVFRSTLALANFAVIAIAFVWFGKMLAWLVD